MDFYGCAELFSVVIILVAHPKSQNSGIPFLPHVSEKPSARWNNT